VKNQRPFSPEDFKSLADKKQTFSGRFLISSFGNNVPNFAREGPFGKNLSPVSQLPGSASLRNNII
jgi:hypothetical protein